MQFYYSNARTALREGLRAAGLSPGERVLLPDYLCDVVIHPLEQLGLRPVFYPLIDDLSPDWEALRKFSLVNSPAAIIMVNYFGQPANFREFRTFCTERGQLLLEDNAHGFGGKYKGRDLGTFGDIGFSSPRKILDTPYGGVLHKNMEFSKEIVTSLPTAPLFRPGVALKTLIKASQVITRIIRGVTEKRRNWNDPFLYQEASKPGYGIDWYSRWRIESANWEKIADTRRRNWVLWDEFAKDVGLHPVFTDVSPESCPWAMPAYANNIENRDKWLDWGTRERVFLFPWPSLPVRVVASSGQALSRWKRMVCFPLDRSPEELGVHV